MIRKYYQHSRDAVLISLLNKISKTSVIDDSLAYLP